MTTIIILLILAGITISQLTGSGLFNNSQKAKTEYENAQEKEETEIAKYTNEINSYVSGNRDNDTIISMTKKELDTYIEDAINTKLGNYYCTANATSTSTASLTKPAVIIENYKNGNDWYRIWSDGWIEQGGRSTGGGDTTGATTTFKKQFKTTDYTLTTSDTISSHSNQAACALIVTSKTTTGFNISSSWVTSTSWNWSALDFNWYACGY